MRSQQLIFDAVEDLLVCEPEAAEKVTVAEICKRAGVSTATYYSLFPSRNAACLACFNDISAAATSARPHPFFHDVFKRLLDELNPRTANLVRYALVGYLESPARESLVYLGDPREVDLTEAAPVGGDFLDYWLWALTRTDEWEVIWEQTQDIDLYKPAIFRLAMEGVLLAVIHGALRGETQDPEQLGYWLQRSITGFVTL